MKKLRLGINARYLRSYNLRGFNRYTFCLLKEFQKRPGIETYLYTEMKSPLHHCFQAELQVQTRSLSTPKTLLWEQIVLPVALKKDAIDVFHAPCDGGLPSLKTTRYVLTYHHTPESGLQHRLQSGELRGRLEDYIDTGPRNSLGSQMQYWRSKLMRSLYLHAADRIITVSHFAQWQLVHLLGVPEQKVRVIYEAPDEHFRMQ